MHFWIWFTVVRPAHCWQFLLLRESRKVNLTLSSVFLAQMPICMGANTWWWTVAKRIPSWALLYHICREYEFLALGWLIAGNKLLPSTLLLQLKWVVPFWKIYQTLFQDCMNRMSFRWNCDVRCPPENHVQKLVQLIMDIIMELLRGGKSYSKVTIPCPCTESDLDGVDFLHSRPYGAFWICALTAVDHTSIFAEWLLDTRSMLTIFTLSFQKVI